MNNICCANTQKKNKKMETEMNFMDNQTITIQLKQAPYLN